MGPMVISLYDRSHTELVELISAWGFSAIHAARLWSYLYRERVTSFEGMTELPKRLRDRLLAETSIVSLNVAAETDSSDTFTRKYLLELHDRQRIETVMMRFPRRVTACLSSQAGCALGCVFCATGQQGFTRNLSVGEIVSQTLHVARASQERLRNIVVMGMGEPLLNYDAVMQALDIVRDPGGLAIGNKQITISTVGVVPGIVRLADERRPYSLAVSLHAATQEERLKTIPSARTWPLDEIIEACRYYVTKLNRKIFFEWTLIEGTSDSPEQARALAESFRGLESQVNLIPLNPTSGYGGQPTDGEAVQRFQSILRDHGIPTTVRQRRGIDIAAGCGQLAASWEGEAPAEP